MYLPSRILALTDQVNDGGDGDGDADDKVTIRLKGRGSSREPPLPGIPEEPMHVLIEGPQPLVDKAELLVDSLLQEADVIIHDRLVAPEILDHARRDAVCIDVGKAKGAHSLTQHQINELLVREASDGRRVVRLKLQRLLVERGGPERRRCSRCWGPGRPRPDGEARP